MMATISHKIVKKNFLKTYTYVQDIWVDSEQGTWADVACCVLLCKHDCE
jgi:hypothetical protein